MRAAFTYATASVTGTPSVVAPGGRLQVNWSTPISHSSLDWIGLFRAGASNFDYIDYQYTDGVVGLSSDLERTGRDWSVRVSVPAQ
jgi:hypothetical protein